jgi:hypothetical protein
LSGKDDETMAKIGLQLRRRREQGQSLTETALFLPIFLLLLAGVVEISNLVITQNRISTAARAAARFGANGGEASQMWVVALNSVTQTLSFDEALWDIWSIRGAVDGSGSAFNDWSFEHIYGLSQTVEFDSVNEAALRQQVLAQLAQEGNPAGIEIVGTYVLHDRDAILGLNVIPALAGMNSIRGLNVMRRVGLLDLTPTAGCDAFPIAVEEGIRSVTPALYPTGAPGGTLNRTYQSFLQHQPDVPLLEAREGYVYLIWNGFGSGNFGWLRWNQYVQPSADTLANSLRWPGDSRDYNPINPNNPNSAFPGFQEVDDPTDREMNIGDRVAANTGSVNSSQVRDALDAHITRGRQLRLIVWRQAEGGYHIGNQGNDPSWYRITRFGVFRLHGHSLPQDWILAEFIRWDSSCGQ